MDVSANALQAALGASPASAISPGGLLSYAFKGPTWGRWIACLRAAWGESLTPEQTTLFREVAGGRNPPKKQVREVWAIVGRRGGKDSVASAVVTSVALQDHRPHLRPGEKATCLCIASTVDQARIINRYVRAYFAEGSPLRQFVVKETDDVLELSTGAEIIVSAGNFRVVRGKAIACVVLDEICFYPSQDAASSDTELLAALEPALETLPGAILVAISSPHRRAGVAYERWAKFFGKDDEDILVLHAPTKAFNPLVRDETIAKALERDPDKAASEWLAEWRSDIGTFIDRELVESAVEPGVAVRAPQFNAEYTMFVDPSGGRGSSFAACVAHTEGEMVFIDALFERRPPCDPDAVVTEVGALAREYRIGTVRGDNFAGSWPSEAFAKEGLVYILSEQDKSQLFLNTLPLFASGKICLLDNPRLSHQLTQLERRVTKTGRDVVTAASGAADDLANCVAGAAVNAVADGPALMRSASVFAAAVPTPPRVQVLVSTTFHGRDGMIATAFFGVNRQLGGWSRDDVFLLDAALGPLTPSLAQEVIEHLAEIQKSFPRGTTVRRIFFPEALQAMFVSQAHGQIEAAKISGPLFRSDELDGESYDETPQDELNDLEVEFIQLQHHGVFKITHDAVAKSKTLPLAAAMTFRPGEKIEDSTLRVAILEGVKLCLAN